MKKRKELSEFSEATPLEITTCSKKSSYYFPNSITLKKNNFKYNVENFRNILIEKCPESTEGVTLDILKENFSELYEICVYQAPLLIYSNEEERVNYQNLYNNFPSFEGKKSKESQQVMFADFYFDGKDAFLEVGSKIYHTKESDDFRAAVIKGIYPDATVFNVTYDNSPKEFKEKLIEVLETINQLPNKENTSEKLDKTKWIKKYNNNIETARLIKYCEKVIQLHPDDKKICEEMTQQIETLKALIS